MKQTKLKLSALFLLLLSSTFLQAQLLVDNSVSSDSLAKLISGEGVQIFNAQIDCGADGYGYYNASNTNLGIEEGLILTTGTIDNAIGPNDVSNETHYFPPQWTPDSHPLLDSYTGSTTWEYCEFEFDIIPQGDTITFDFVFASEEYEEWVGSQYNDVFAFFISGPGIVGDPGAGSEKNIALIPGTTTPVTINNVNQGQNTSYYQNNDNGQEVQYDGFTQDLFAMSPVQPCETYHLRLVVADVADKLWDSGVFIEKIESNNVLLLSQTAGNIPDMVEGCNDGTVIFSRQLVTSSPLTIDYWIDGTATNGTDYPLIGSDPNPAVAKQITIPAFQADAFLPIAPFADGISEGQEYIMIYIGNPYCSSMIMDSLKFYISDSLFVTVAPIVDTLCLGESVQLTGQGGSGFSWVPTTGLNAPGSDTTLATPTSTTVYTFTTTASFCSDTRDVTLFVSDPQINGSSTNVSCNGIDDGEIDITASNGFSPYNFSWTGPGAFTSANEDLSNLEPGDYFVNLTDNNNCSGNASFTITEPDLLVNNGVISDYNGFEIDCNGQFTGWINSNVSGGTTPYSYDWVGPNGFVSSSQNISSLESGSYIVSITDANGCQINEVVDLNEPSALATNPLINDAICFDSCNGEIDLAVSGGVLPYIYNWNTGASTEDLTNLCAGIFSNSITDGNGCNLIENFTIDQPNEILAAVSTTNSNCGFSDGNVNILAIGGNPGYTYLWDDPGTSTSTSVSNLPAGTYTVTVTDIVGCVGQGSGTINDMAGGSAVASVDVNSTCYDSCDAQASVNMIGGTAPFIYTWSSGGSGISESNLCAGIVSVLVTDDVGCVSTDTVTISQPNMFSSTFNVTSTLCNTSCDGQSTINISGGTGAYSITWDDPGTQTGATATGLCSNTHNVSVTDANLCPYTTTIFIPEPSAISVSESLSTFNGGVNVSCFNFSDGSIDLAVSGGTPGYTYSWTGPSTFSSTDQDIINLNAGTYNLTVTDANNCLYNNNYTLNEPVQISSSTTLSTYNGGVNISCFDSNDGTIDLSPLGGVGPFSYDWQGPNSYTNLNEDIASLFSGWYYYELTDANACTLLDSVELIQPNQLTNTMNVSSFEGGNNLSCYESNDGTITSSPAGGVGPFTYSWNGPLGFNSTLANINGLTAGTYYLTYTDDNTCVGQDSVILSQPDSLYFELVSLNATSGDNINCYGDSSGVIGAFVIGGVSGFQYSWSGPGSSTSSDESWIGIPAGMYYLTLLDTNNCMATDSLELTQPNSPLDANITPSLFPGGSEISCFGANDGSLEVNYSGGSPGYEVAWRNEDGNLLSDSSFVGNLGPGIYEVAVTDTNSCVLIFTYEITEPDLLFLTSDTTGSFCEAMDGAIDITVSGGIPSYLYSWSTGDITEDISNINSGDYIIEVTDTNGCILNDTIFVPGTPGIQIISSQAEPRCYQENTGSIGIEVTQGTEPYQFTWNTADTSAYVYNLQAGYYDVTIEDEAGCSLAVIFELFDQPELTIDLYSPSSTDGYNIELWGGHDGSIDATINGGSPDYIYEWSTGSSDEDIDNLLAGTYTLLVTDFNGCIAVESLTLTQPEPLEMPSAMSPNNDGKNDYYFIKGLESFSTAKITVINRWGNVVYEQDNYDNTWSGENSAGQKLPDGTYFVILDINGGEISMTKYVDIRQ